MERFGPALRAAGYKATPARLALLEVLRKSRKPLSISGIMRGLHAARGKKIDRVTAYRILAILTKIGLVRAVDLRHGHADYEFAAGDDHHHLVCTRCGLLEDFKNCDLDALARKALRQSKRFKRIDQHSLEFFGVCKKCTGAS